MGPHLNKLPLLEKLFTVNDHILFLCIYLLVDLPASVKYPLFFFGDDRQFSQQFFMHVYPTLSTPGHPHISFYRKRRYFADSISFVSSIYSFALRLLFL